jgi:tetratricopeptide (TPR) repeat protein
MILLAALMVLLGMQHHAAPMQPGSDAPMLIESEQGLERLRAGREAILHFRLVQAEAIFAQLAALPDGEVAAAFHLETISLLKLIASDKEVYFEEFLARSDALKDLLDKAPASPWRALLAAEADLHRAMGRAKRGQYLRAALAGRSAYHGYKQLLEHHPDFYDAYKGMGVLHVALGAVPGAQRKFLRFLGFSGTIEGGLRELRIAAEKSEFNREEAQVYLALIDMKLMGSAGTGGKVLASFWHSYPDSPLIAHLYGSYLYENRQAAEAERIYRRVATPADGVFPVDYVDFYLADALFRQNRFAEAERYYRRYLDRHAGLALKATAMLRLGLVLEMQDRRGEAIGYYRQVQATREFDSDAVAQRQARMLQQAPMTERERTLLLAQNAYDSSRYADAHALLQRILEDAGASSNEQAEAAYRRGRTFHAAGRLDDALASYASAIALHADPAARWAPWSQYFTGLILEQRGEVEAAIQAFRAALVYAGSYDYHQALERDTKIALERLGE